MTDWMNDTDALEEQYADASNLNARIALHERFSTTDREFWPWVFDQFNLPDDARVLTLGGGPGNLWRANAERIPENWNAVVTDFSPGMVETARENFEENPNEFAVAVADAATIPFAEETFDAVTANHMLYHVPDRERAFREIRRVLKPGGRLHATTNGERNNRELRDVMSAFVDEPLTRGDAFQLENGGEQLREFFDSVELRRYDDALRVTEVEPLVAYALSCEEFADVSALREAFEREFEKGVFHVEKDVGMFVVRKKP